MYQFWRYWLNLKGYLKEGVNIYTEQEGEVSRCSPAPEGRVCSGWYGPKRESHYIKSLYIYYCAKLHMLQQKHANLLY